MTTGSGDWSLDRIDGVVLARCALLSRVSGVEHFFSTRGGAASTVEVLIDRAGLTGKRPFPIRQTHGTQTHWIGGEPEGTIEVDALIAVGAPDANWCPAVRTADCLPILVAERDGALVAAIHAGWRGTAAGIAGTVIRQIERNGVNPAELVVALGPSIRACCYEVGPDVVEGVARGSGVAAGQVRGRTREGRLALDLARANEIQLREAGVPGESIRQAPWCTCCEPALFHSYRRDGESSGRQTAAIGWRSPV